MKVWNYVMMFTTMIIFLEFVGLPTGAMGTLNNFGVSINTTSTELINADLDNSYFYNYLFSTTGILVLILASTTLIVGLFAKSFDMNLVLLPFLTTVLVLFVSTGVAIIHYVQGLNEGWLTAIIATIFVPLIIGYIVAMVEFARGTD